MLSPKVSICIPTYQQVEYLRRALESVQRQTFDDYEVVVTDDSLDNSVEELVRSFPLRGRLKYFRNSERLGSPRNWSRAIELSSGEYVKILHHDDWFTSADSLRKFVELLDDDRGADFAFSATQVIDVLNNRQWLHKCSKDDFEALKSSPRALFVANMVGAPSATIFRRSAYVVEFDPKLKWLVDIDFYIAMMLQGVRVAMTSDPLITTPTNVDHQVTESCIGNAVVELGEYQYVFRKHSACLANYSLARKHLRSLFERYRARTKGDLDKMGVPLTLDEGTFLSLGIRSYPVAVLARLVGKGIYRAAMAKRGAVSLFKNF